MSVELRVQQLETLVQQLTERVRKLEYDKEHAGDHVYVYYVDKHGAKHYLNQLSFYCGDRVCTCGFTTYPMKGHTYAISRFTADRFITEFNKEHYDEETRKVMWMDEEVHLMITDNIELR